MPIKINEGSACLEIDGQVIATARVLPDGWREVSCWPRFVRSQPGRHGPDDHRTSGQRTRTVMTRL